MVKELTHSRSGIKLTGSHRLTRYKASKSLGSKETVYEEMGEMASIDVDYGGVNEDDCASTYVVNFVVIATYQWADKAPWEMMMM